MLTLTLNPNPGPSPALPFLKNTVTLLYPFAPLILLYGLSLALGWNFTHALCSFYKYRVK